MELSKGAWIKAAQLAMEPRGQGRLIPLTDPTIAALPQRVGTRCLPWTSISVGYPGLKLHQVPYL